MWTPTSDPVGDLLNGKEISRPSIDVKWKLINLELHTSHITCSEYFESSHSTDLILRQLKRSDWRVWVKKPKPEWTFVDRVDDNTVIARYNRNGDWYASGLPMTLEQALRDKSIIEVITLSGDRYKRTDQ